MKGKKVELQERKDILKHVYRKKVELQGRKSILKNVYRKKVELQGGGYQVLSSNV